MAFETQARSLFSARKQGKQLDLAEPVKSLDDAYQLQAALSELHDGAVAGWKIGATTEAALNTLNLSKPFHGPLHKPFHQSAINSTLNVEIFSSQPTIVETEFVVGLAKDIAATGTTTADDVSACVAWVAPGFELVGTRYIMPLAGNGFTLIADSAGNVGTIVGEPLHNWQTLNLDSHEATLSINAEVRATGHSGQSIGGNPLAMVAWLANDLASSGQSLKAGECVFCGTCSGMIDVKAGDHLQADMGALGNLSVTLSSR